MIEKPQHCEILLINSIQNVSPQVSDYITYSLLSTYYKCIEASAIDVRIWLAAIDHSIVCFFYDISQRSGSVIMVPKLPYRWKTFSSLFMLTFDDNVSNSFLSPKI